MPKKAKAFCPAGISSFFQVCDREPSGKPLTDPERIGARGGGFAIQKGVTTEVNVVESKEREVKIIINGKPAPEAETTRTVVNILLEKVDSSYSVTVRHWVKVPIGAGFGASGAGALSTALALTEALNIGLSYNQVARIAHIAEVNCRTGLGTVSGLMIGGCVVVLEPGAPNHGSVDRIPVPPDYHMVAGVFKPRLTREFLESVPKRELINKWGQKTIDTILAEPSLQKFLQASKEFAIKTGLATKRVRKLMERAERAGAIGAAQNMVGEAVHALVKADKVESVVKAFEEFLPHEKVLVAKIDLQGARLVR